MSVVGRVVLYAIDTYQRDVAPRHQRTRCPFTPTCSEYGRLAFEKHRSFTATRLTIGRLRRCRPDYGGPLVDYP